MKKHSLLLVAGLISPGAVFSQASPYRGLWVGEVRLNGVNEVSVPLDANNVPRAPNPAVTTPAFDTANLRLILHVNGAGQVNLLKQVAILNRKAGQAKSENDLALVTDERLYGNFPPQPAQRIASVVFDFGDARTTAAVDAVVNAAAAAAATSVMGNASTSTDTVRNAATTAATTAAQAIISQADAADRYAVFLRDVMNSAAVTALSAGGQATAAQDTAAATLRTGSFYADTRGEDMIAALEAKMAEMTGAAAAADRKAAAHNVAAAYADVSNTYQRFIAGELTGDAIIAAASAAATAAAAQPRQNIAAITGTAGSPPDILTVNHQLATNMRISISGAPIAAYNGVKKVTRVDGDHFVLQGVAFVPGKPVTGYAPSSSLTPVTITSPGHGLTTGTLIVISGAATTSYNGTHYVTRLSDDAFSIPAAFAGDSGARGAWASRGGNISGYESAPGGVSGTKVTAPNHGLNNGESIVITGAGGAVYNNTHAITRIDANSFTIPVAFGGNPQAKGSWSVQNPVGGYGEPAEKSTTVTSAAHGLNTGDRITISGAGREAYNATFEVEKVDANQFVIPVIFSAADGNPSVKGQWAPATGGTWKLYDPVLTATDSDPKVNDAKTEALRVKIASYDDTRGTLAISQITAAIAAAAADDPGTTKTLIEPAALAAGQQALAELVGRSGIPHITPTADYTAFVRSNDARFTDYRELAPIVAAAAAAGAYDEKQNVLATAQTVQNKAKERILAAITSVYAAAARAQRTELPLTGGFGPGISGLTGTIILPANHPTNPFRHRRHPDHSTGLDITRVVTLNFDGAPGTSLTAAGFGVDSISGTYGEEIHGLHKPLGPQKNIGLKVTGTFTLQRLSHVDALNAR